MRGIQDLTLETEELDVLEPMLAAAVAALGLAHLWRPGTNELVEQYPSHAAAYLTRHAGNEPFDLGWRPPHLRQTYYQPICRLSLGREPPKPLDEEVPLASPADLVPRALDLVRSVDPAPFAATGEGPFRGCEGMVTNGYRLHGGPLEPGLGIYLCHFYISK